MGVLKALSNRGDQWVKLGEIARGCWWSDERTLKRQTDPSYAEVPYLRVGERPTGISRPGSGDDHSSSRKYGGEARVWNPMTSSSMKVETATSSGVGGSGKAKFPDCIHQNHVFRARLRTDEFDPKFVSMHGNTFGRTWFETMGKQTTNLDVSQR